MRTDLSKALDNCVERISKGETIEACLDEYRHIRGQLEPLLHMALSITDLPKASPSDEFKRMSKARLMMRLRQESIQAEAARSSQRMPLLNGLTMAWQRFWRNTAESRKVAAAVATVMVIALGAILYQLGSGNLMSPTPVVAPHSTLSIFSGSVEVKVSDGESWQPATDGMVLSQGARAKTAAGSHALLTFFEGSTIKLDPGTDIEIRQIEFADERTANIVLKQRTGRTWSRVEKMAGLVSHYQIETPSASATVRGTLFMTEVDRTGFTRVMTTEGSVSVAAQGVKVFVPANHQTQVEAGNAPSHQILVPDAESALLISIGMPAIGSVRDPTGSSTGIWPNGLSFNQIEGSQSSLLSDGTQLITIPQPLTGEYLLALRYLSQGTAQYSIQGESGGDVVFEHSGALDAVEGGGWLVRFQLQVDDGLIVDGTVSGVEPLGVEMPEKIVEVELAREKAKPIRPSAPSDNSIDGTGGDQDDADKGAPDKGDADKGDTDKGGLDKGDADKGDTGKGAPDEGDTGKGAPDKGSAPKGASDKGDTGKGAPDKGDTGKGAPDKGDAPKGAPDKGDAPKGAPDKGNTPQGAPDKGNTPQGAPDKGNTPQGAPDKGSAPKGAPDKGNTPKGAPDKGNTPKGAPDKGSAGQVNADKGSASTGAPDKGNATKGKGR